MKQFETREAARILHVPEERIRSCVRAGFLKPRQGPDRRYRFSFQDLLLLKTTKGLLDSGIPARRVARLMGSLRRQLPEETQLTSLTIYADGSRVVAWDGSARWEPDSGQFLFNFDVATLAERAAGSVLTSVKTDRAKHKAEPAGQTERPKRSRGSAQDVALADRAERAGARRTRPKPDPPRQERPAIVRIDDRRDLDEASANLPRQPSHASRPRTGLSAEQWYDLACELESESRQEARHAYHRALKLDPTLADAHVNLGRLYHEARELEKAEAHYRAAAEGTPEDPTVWFNLAVLREDQGHAHEAIMYYRRAIDNDPDYADAHYNLGLLLDALGRRSEAMSSLMKARRLMGQE